MAQIDFRANIDDQSVLSSLEEMARLADRAGDAIERIGDDGQDSLNRIAKGTGDAAKATAGLAADSQKLAEQRKRLAGEEQKAGKESLSLYARLKKRVTDFGNSLKKAFNEGVADIVKITSVATLASKGISAITDAAANAFSQFFAINRDIADLQSDVAKTTGLTIDEVRALTEELKKIDTRTPLEELLQISTVAGRLGVQGQQGVQSFTEAVNVLVTALGEDLGGGADVVTDSVGKLSNILFGATKDGEVLAGNLLNIGNALNVLSAEGAAGAGAIVEYGRLIGSVAIPLGVTQGEILGLSATLDELGIRSELGSTAVTEILGKLTTDTQRFTKELSITPEVLRNAGFEVSSFEQLVNTDLAGALGFVTKRTLELSNENVDLGQRLRDLGITGSGVRQVFLNLGKETDRLAENIGTATEALQNQDSLLAEYELKNQNLAGATERLGNTLKNLFVQSAVQDFFLALVEGAISAAQGFAAFVEIVKGLPQFLSDNRDAIGALAAALIAFNFQAITANATLLVSRARLFADTAATTGLATAKALLTRAVLGLNAAFRANPIGFVIGLVITLGVAVKEAYERFDTFRAVVDGLRAVAVELFSIFKEAAGAFLDSFNAIKKGDVRGALTAFGRGIVKSSPIGLATGEGKRLGDAFKKGYADSLAANETKAEVQDLKTTIEEVAAATEDLNTTTTKNIELTKEQKKAREDLNKEIAAFKALVADLERAELSGIEKVRAERAQAIAQLEEQEQAFRKLFAEQGRAFDLEEDFARARDAINRKASRDTRAILAQELADKRSQVEARVKAEEDAIRREQNARLKLLDQNEQILLNRAELAQRRRGQTEQEFLISSERAKLQIQIAAQRARLRIIEEQFGPNSPEVQLVRTQIQLLQQEYNEAGNISVAPFEALKQKVLKALNVTEEELAEVLSSAGEAIGAISQLIDAGIQQQLAQQDTLIDSIKGRISETEKLLAEEQRAQEQGFANNVSLYEQSLAEEKRLLEQAEEERAKLQEKQTKRQARQNQLQAASEYALLVIKLLSAEAGKGGLVGVALAIGGLALIAKVVAEQKRVAAKLTEPGFRDGTPYVDGPGTGRSDSITARLSRGERVITARGNAELGGRAMSEREVIDFFKLGRVVAQQGFPITAPDAGRAAREAKEATKEKELQMLQQQREIAKEAALDVVRAIKDQPVSIPMPKGTLVKQGNKETWYRQEE